ncbi:hypothetical protein [Catenulispora subtropica]|uniref:Uncharacterized protein n=1 Tax=Catenulispora subtropica TaxID=450798 RepID=A0ABP5CZL5_9ACTN
MTENLSARRGMLIAGFAALALLALVAAFDNQGTHTWRLDQMTGDREETAHSWTAAPVQALSAFDWRVAPATGEPTRIFLGFLGAAVLVVLFTFLLVLLVCRGVAASRGRWALFAASWFATAAGAGLALVAGSAIAGESLVIGATSGGTRFSYGDTYYLMLNAGLVFGLFAGWLVGLVAVITYGVSEGADGNGDGPGYTSPFSYDYGSAAPTSGPDYSFSPGSPYSASSSTPDYGNSEESSASAPTQIVPPPQENDPYGGGNRSY